MKPLTLEETKLKEEMKERCLAKGQYIDENAKAKFEMLCHLEDFEVQYWELQQENKKYKEVIDKINNYIDNYDIFKVFSFPLMKRWEEEQVKSSIDYEFKTSLIKDLKDILKEVE